MPLKKKTNKINNKSYSDFLVFSRIGSPYRLAKSGEKTFTPINAFLFFLFHIWQVIFLSNSDWLFFLPILIFYFSVSRFSCLLFLYYWSFFFSVNHSLGRPSSISYFSHVAILIGINLVAYISIYLFILSALPPTQTRPAPSIISRLQISVEHNILFLHLRLVYLCLPSQTFLVLF